MSDERSYVYSKVLGTLGKVQQPKFPDPWSFCNGCGGVQGRHIDCKEEEGA